jgi:hypothetical protein
MLITGLATSRPLQELNLIQLRGFSACPPSFSPCSSLRTPTDTWLTFRDLVLRNDASKFALLATNPMGNSLKCPCLDRQL